MFNCRISIALEYFKVQISALYISTEENQLSKITSWFLMYPSFLSLELT